MFPNPASEAIYLANPNGLQIENISVYDAAGKQLYKSAGASVTSMPDITAWAPGMLIINDNTVSLDGTTGQGIKPSDITVGTLVNARPAAALSAGDDLNNVLSMSSILLVRMNEADIISTGIEEVSGLDFRRWQTSNPLRSGRLTSRRMICGCSASARPMASEPVAASLVWNPANCRIRLTA